jgi:predicted dehydrogenase
MNRVKTGVIGVGSLGRHHARWLSKLESSEYVGCFDSDASRAKQIAGEVGGTAYTSLDELLSQVTAVSIAATTSAHFDIAGKALARGVHCLIEKPVTATLREAHELKRIAVNSKCKVSVGQIERFNPAVQAIVAEGVRPSFIEAHRLAAFNPRGTDVAVILDLMIHDIDLALFLVKSPVKDIQSAAVSVVSGQVDIANTRLTFDNGAVANLTASRISLTEMRKVRLFQPSLYCSLDLARKEADLYRLGNPGELLETAGMRLPLGTSGRDIIYQKITDSGKDMLGAELEHFLASIIGDKPVAVSLDEGISALTVALEVERIGREAVDRHQRAVSING